ncbi:MAG: PDZ domain-containing protein, partial [Planctomycetaceae bacterium]|nr:PDZ domain-containing protein [Planctomycetaceae bacterium]
DESAAVEAEMATGDVITAINEEPVADFTALTERLTAAKAGDEWSLSVTRGDESLTLKVKLGQPK